ncbi:hypothetical protein HHK36_003860 [Tetracentron sinense]|uniref:C3HC-type domain-containing protein n=1 Tax=Tetracentron sinense TaxID=13715 RepID=A0A835DNZ6_TETSI|nr:hypothetical protein HHK36_003860 [Tetracentron sinense]
MREEAISSGGGTMDPLLLARSSSPTPAASSAGASSPAVPMNVGGIDYFSHGQGSKAGSLSCVGSQPPWTSLSTSAGGSAIGSSQPSCRPWERGDLLRRLATYKPSNWFGKPKTDSIGIRALILMLPQWKQKKVAATMDLADLSTKLDATMKKLEDLDAMKEAVFQLKYSNTIEFLWRFTAIIRISMCMDLRSLPVHWLVPEELSSILVEVDNAGEAFAKQLEASHKVSCPWRGNSCTESLVQFPPTPPSALIGGYKDRCDGLLQFLSLPVIAASAIEEMRVSWGPQIDRFLAQSQTVTSRELSFKAENIPGMETSREEAFCIYSHAQKLISLCGWEPRWLLNVQDCEEHSAQSARNGCSFGPAKDRVRQDPGPSKNAFSASTKKDTGKKTMVPESRCESKSPLLDCSLCGATVRVWDFLTVSRPARFAPNNIDIPETSKKMALTRGASAASGINGWVAADGIDKEQTEDRDEVATTDEGKSLSNAGVDLTLTMAGALSSTRLFMPAMSKQFQDADIGRDLMIGQPSSSGVGDRAASYESRGPTTRKRSLEEGGSTVDRPHLRMQQADSIEGTVIDRDGDEVNDGKQYSAGPSKRAHESDIFYAYQSAYQRGSSGAGPSHSLGFEIDIDANKVDPFHQGNDQVIGIPSTRDSARASSVIAMDTVCHSADEDSMESVENYPGDVDDVHFPSPSVSRNPDLNDTSELNYSNQAQQSTCYQPAAGRVTGEMGVSSTNDGDEILNAETLNVHARDGFSFGVSGGSVGMGASHEAEIHGTDVSVHRTDSVVGDADPIAEVTENQGQTGESTPHPRLMDEFVPEEIDGEDPHGDNQDMMSRSVGRADSGSKIDGSAKAESVESGEKISQSHMVANENNAHPSLSCNAIVYSGYEASKEEVTQAGKASLNYDWTYLESNYVAANEIGKLWPPNGESNYEEPTEFDPIKHHNHFCPWVNGNVAAAGCISSGPSSSADAAALCGWELTLDALDAFQSLGHVPVQTVQSESAASLCKVLLVSINPYLLIASCV